MKYCSDCKHKYTMSQSPCTECRSFNKMEKGNPAVDLLEKVKEEINDLHKAHHIWLIDQNQLIDECSEIVDNHISELKGEKITEKVDCDNTDCRNCVNHNACDYENPN